MEIGSAWAIVFALVVNLVASGMKQVAWPYAAKVIVALLLAGAGGFVQAWLTGGLGFTAPEIIQNILAVAVLSQAFYAMFWEKAEKFITPR